MSDTHFWIVFSVVFGPFFIYSVVELALQYRQYVDGGDS
jgi:hypothetical protein